MLRTDADAIIFNEDGQAIGIESDGKKAMASKIICDPSYALSCEKVVEKGQIIRCICLLDHPVGMTKNAPSCQLIIPQKQLGRNSGIYIFQINVYRYLYHNGQCFTQCLPKRFIPCNDQH
jgi:Rab GDP dissociation inhibitor